MFHKPATIFFVLYLGATIYLSLYPFEFLGYARTSMLFWVTGENRRVLFDTFLNVLLYIPLGASAVAALGRSGAAWLAAVLFGSLLSLGMEIAQLHTVSRFGNLRDLAANSLGAALGASASYVLLHPKISARTAAVFRMARWRIGATGALFLSLWFLWQAFPFAPYISLYELARTWQGVREAEWSWTAAGSAMFGFYVLALVIGVRSRWLWIALLALPFQAVLPTRMPSLAALAGAFAGWAAAALVKAPAVTAALLSVWLVFEEFRPFRFTAETREFSWPPFQSWFESGIRANYPVFFGKTLLYASVVWALRRCGLGWTISIAIPALILAVGEWTQRHLEGRTPETTDLVLLAAGASLLRLTVGRVARPD